MKFFTKKNLLLEGARKNERGLTLVEIMIVIALLGSLMVILMNVMGGSQDRAKIDQTVMLMKGPISSAINMYRIHTGKIPKKLADLVTDPGNVKRWSGPYLDKSQMEDVWGNEFKYEPQGRQFRLTSAGPDDQFGTEDDIVYPEE